MIVKFEQESIEVAARMLQSHLPQWNLVEKESLEVLDWEDYCQLAELLGLHIEAIRKTVTKKTAAF
jgi:hypothetical protein